MPAFECAKAYWLARMDMIVLTGRPHGVVEAGMYVDLPVAVNGPGPVPIHGVEIVQFRGMTMPALTIAYEHLDAAPKMEFRDLEGRTLAVTDEG